LGPYVKQYSVRVGAQGHDEALLAMGRSSTGPETCLPFTAWPHPPPCHCQLHYRSTHATTCTYTISELHTFCFSTTSAKRPLLPSLLAVYCVASKLQVTSTLPPFLYTQSCIYYHSRMHYELLDTVTHFDFQ